MKRSQQAQSPGRGPGLRHNSSTLKTSAAMAGGYRWVTAEEASAYLDLGCASVRKLIQQGKLKAVRLGTGRQYRTTFQWCDDYVNSITIAVEAAHHGAPLYGSDQPTVGLAPIPKSPTAQAYEILDRIGRRERKRSA